MKSDKVPKNLAKFQFWWGRGGILKVKSDKVPRLAKFQWGGGILYRFIICVTSSIFLKYSASFHECLGYYIYLLLFPILFTLLLIFNQREIK